jgi:hypothetical protein
MNKRVCRSLSLTLAMLLAGGPALPLMMAQAAGTFYIAAGGSDGDLGTDSGHPWAHLKCMVGASGQALHTPVAGDVFILKGGDTWGNANFPCTWNWSGTPGNPIMVTVDKTWFTGASWTQPKWDAGGVVINGPLRPPQNLWHVNAFIDQNNGNFGVNYTTWDNIEMTGLYFTGGPQFNTCAYVIGGPGSFTTLDHLYIHGWTHDTYANGTRDAGCNIIMGTSVPQNNGSVIQNGHISGADSTGGGDCCRNYLWPNYINNAIHDMVTPIVGGGGAVNGTVTISGNDLYNCHNSFDPASHPNILETLGSTNNVTYYIHDNRLHDSATGCETSYLSNFAAGAGVSIYYWNNVSYNTLGNPLHIDSNATSHPDLYIWNNTIVPKAGQYCFLHGKVGGTIAILKIQNNHCITTAVQAVDPVITATIFLSDHNVLQTPTAATTQGYTSAQTPYVYAPTDATDTTVTTPGVDLTANCAGSLISLCRDTTYGQFVTGTTVTGAARTSLGRPDATGWNIGAYQLGSQLQRFSPSINLRLGQADSDLLLVHQ